MSGCDSGTCTYCYNIRARAGRQRDAGVCWLRRKLSETELSSYCVSEKASSNEVPDISHDESKQESIWQHALLEPEQAARLLLHRKVINAPWAWKQEYLVQPTPPARGGTLTTVANFSSPVNRAGTGHQSTPQADIVCGMEFEPHGWLLATAGVSKQVRLYSLANALEGGNHIEQSSPLRVHRLASKLSSLTWHPDQPGVATVGDYDGVVVQLDLESGHVVAEGDEHSGRRVWSVSHSQSKPHLVASASEDGSVIFWAGNFLAEVVGKLTPNPNLAKSGGNCNHCTAVTAVQFSPFDEYGLAVACADSRAYVYDLRRTSHPVSILQGHSRPVSYVKYLSRDALVTASTDATLKTWSLPLANSNTNQMSPLPVNKTYSGHPNTKNFVGLSVYPEEGLVACGSEGSSVYTYSLAWEVPLASASLMGGEFCQADALCSAVAWQPAGSLPPGNSPLLAAASSDGHIKVLGLDLVVD
jgi:E3 ubiquitin-protein ligase RFWD2